MNRFIAEFYGPFLLILSIVGTNFMLSEVLADLIIAGESKGPHLFWCRIAEVPGDCSLQRDMEMV